MTTDEQMKNEDLIQEGLREPVAAIGYGISRQMAALFPDKAILEGDACSFGLEEYAAGGQCTLALRPAVHSQIATSWGGAGRCLQQHAENAWYTVAWEGHTVEVLLISWAESGASYKSRSFWI